MPTGEPSEQMAPSTAREIRDGDLVRACISGDERAWAQLVRKYERLVYSIPRRMGLQSDLVDDTFQEVFAILLRSLPSLQYEAALPQWLVTTTRRVAMRLVQRHRRIGPLRASEPTDDPRAEVERWEAVESVGAALALLEPSCRDLLMALTRDDQVSYLEVAAQLGIPIGSIGPRRARCLAKLLKHLRALRGGDAWTDSDLPEPGG